MIPEWLWGKTIGVFDLETDYLPDITQIFCNSVSIVAIDEAGTVKILKAITYTQYWTEYSHGSIMESIEVLNSCDYVCGHNIIGFDNVQINALLGVTLLPPSLDTMILAKIIFSRDDLFAIDAELGLDKGLWGKYSLKAFGKRLGDQAVINMNSGTIEEQIKAKAILGL